MMWQSAIATQSGKSTYPYLIDHVVNVNGKSYDQAVTEYTESLFSTSTASKVYDIMLANGTNNYSNSIPNHTVAVKSGTAQIENGDKENSLLVGFDTDEDHPIAFCILIEDKNSTTLTTETIANAILNNLY
jgi:cell division protein FtsI/penicillin-binding protein 2